MITIAGVAHPAGIDVSLWNGDITSALNGCEFALAQASIGTMPDKEYSAHLAEMHKRGVVRGAYHFMVYGPGDARQAKFFLSRCADAEILALDVERQALKYPAVAKGIIAAIRKADALKRPILLYSSRGTWPGALGQTANWVADYVGDPNRLGVSPRIPWLIWQRSGTGLDRDVFGGTLAQLNALAGRK